MDSWITELREQIRIEENICDLLFLGFNKPLIMNICGESYSIPSSKSIPYIFRRSLKKLSEEKTILTGKNYNSFLEKDNNYFCGIYPKIRKKEMEVLEDITLSEKIEDVFYTQYREEDSFLDRYLNRLDSPIYKWTFVYGEGDFHEFRIGKRQDVLKKVRDNLPSEYIEKISWITSKFPEIINKPGETKSGTISYP